MARRQTISIVGAGRAGGAIGLALKQAGYTIGAAWSRSRTGRQRASRLLDAPVLADVAEVAGTSDVVIVAVPDDAIADVANDLARGVRAGCYVVHTSGGVSIEALAPARGKGARIGSVHPLQTLTGARPGAQALRGAAVAVTCGMEDRNALFRLARAWGGRPFMLEDAAKPVYHAAAVFASNYVVTSLWAALQLMRSVGVRDARPILAPLVDAAVRNTIERGPEKAITGPVARGDSDAVRRHLQALKEEDEAIADAYDAFARLTARLVGTDLSA